MTYIRIANKNEGVNRLFLEKLGLSTKRDDENTIGQFGSGSKFAPIAALRNGLEWVNVGRDENGPYRMEFIVVNEDGIDSIYYKYTVDGEEYLKPSSFTIDAGVLSWDSYFQIFREAFSNALDEYISLGVDYSINFVDDIKYVEEEFAVYITANDELIDIVNNFDNWFSINRTPIYKTDVGSILDPIDDQSNIYHKSVHVYKQIDCQYGKALFDYELNNVTLNEERRLRDTYYAMNHVSNLWISAFQSTPSSHDYNEAYSICKKIVDNINHDRWEFAEISSYYFQHLNFDTDNALLNAWRDTYGDNAVALAPNQQSFMGNLSNIYEKRGIIIDNPTMIDALHTAHIPSLEDVIGDGAHFDFVSFEDGPKKSMFDDVMNLVRKYDPRIDTEVDEIKVFTPSGEQKNLLGVAKGSSIYLSTESFKDTSTLVGTIIHELDHVVTGLTDSDTLFRSAADKRIADLLIKIYGEASD
jgi:hypothetical protein